LIYCTFIEQKEKEEKNKKERESRIIDTVGGLYKDCRKVEVEYTFLDNPVRTAECRDMIIQYCRVKYAPFDKDGNGNRGYLVSFM